MTVFALTAPRYWAAGLPAIPLIEKQKRPAVNGWQLFADRQPTEEEKEAWLNHFPDGNIGLPMGPAAGLVAVDIDTDDPKVLAVLDAILPKSPWTRIGKKGAVKVFRYSGERTTRIKGSDGAMIAEILSKGTQFVLPPSIHPDTQLPYRANCDLLDVLSLVPALPVGIEDLIREALKQAGIEVAAVGSNRITNFVPAGARDNTMVWHAGLLARAVTRGERTLLEALGEMRSWVETYVEKVVGDPLSVEKAQKKVVEYLVKDVSNGPTRLPMGWDEGLGQEDKEQMGLPFTENDECWDFERMREVMEKSFEEHPEPGSSGRRLAVDTMLRRMAASSGSLSPTDVDFLLRTIAQKSGKTVGLTALQKQLRDLRRGELVGENHSEIANAVKAHIERYGAIRYEAGRFWQWQGAYWRELDEGDIATIVGENFGDLPLSKRAGEYREVTRYLRNLVKSPLKAADAPNGVNFANGFLTSELNLIPHQPDQGATYVLPYRYRPEVAGNAPLFSQYLLDCWGADPDFEQKVMALQEAIGATLMGVAPKFQRAFCVYGVGESGKSTLANLIIKLLPENSVSNVAPTDWKDRFMPAQMLGKLLNHAGELTETGFIAGAVFKSIVAGEGIEAQRKNEQIFRFEPICAQLFCSNHLPRSNDMSDGFNRRWLFFTFNHRIDPSKMDRDLVAKIVEDEREAIAAWAVEGLRRLAQQGDYTLPASHVECVERMMVVNNSVFRFLRSPRVIKGKKAASLRVSMENLYNEYSSFMLQEAARRENSNSFAERVRELQNRFCYTFVSGEAPMLNNLGIRKKD